MASTTTRDQVDRAKFTGLLSDTSKMAGGSNYQYIFQLDDVNNSILAIARQAGINAVPLFDLSGGAGQLPQAWPRADVAYSGYAGGLSPENVIEQLKKIEEAAWGHRIWVDVETHVRSADDQTFDLDKVRAFLEAVKLWVDQAGPSEERRGAVHL